MGSKRPYETGVLINCVHPPLFPSLKIKPMEAEAIWIKVQARLKAYIRSKVQDEATADDLLQEVFLRMHHKLHQLNEVEKAEYWLFRIAQNTVHDHYRRQRSRKAVLPAPEAEPGEEETESGALTEEVSQWLPAMLELLPEKYREALYLTDIEGLTQRELAGKLGISYSGAKSRVQRGREKLREIVLLCCEVATDRYGNVLGYQPRFPRKTEKREEPEEECCPE